MRPSGGVPKGYKRLIDIVERLKKSRGTNEEFDSMIDAAIDEIEYLRKRLAEDEIYLHKQWTAVQ